jgi:hypothetical protein
MVFGSAWTECTIVQSAGRLATFAWPTMSAHPESTSQIKCKLACDPRLVAGATTIVAHVAHHAGLDDSAVSQISKAVEDTCAAVALALEEAGHLRGEVEFAAAEFSDHVEVAMKLLSHAPDSSSAPLASERWRDIVEKIREKLKSATIGGVNVEAQDGNPQVTLVKSCGASKRRAVF